MKLSADVFKDFAQIPQLPKESPKPVECRPKYNAHTVEKGEIVPWTPIDQTAAKMLYSSPWYCKPPEPEPNMKGVVKVDNFTAGDMKVEPSEVDVQRRVGPDGYVEELVNENSVTRPLVEHHERAAKQRISGLENLNQRISDLHDAIRLTASELGPQAKEVDQLLRKTLTDLREKRFGIDTETRMILNDLKDVRTFFLGPDHVTEIERLKEFLDLCERLKRLKDSGFLDVIADTLIRLS